jgi:hypothetical protein
MQKLTTTIRREPLAQIIAGIKKVEYREIKPYWEERLARYQTPFLLRLINGMSADAPEATVEVLRVERDKRHGVFELHLGQVLEVRNW